MSRSTMLPPNDNLMPGLWGNGKLLPTIGIKKLKQRLADQKEGFYTFKFRGAPYHFLKIGTEIYAIDPRAQAEQGGMSELFYAQNIDTGEWKIAKKMTDKKSSFNNHHKILQELKRSKPNTLSIDSANYLLMDVEEGMDLLNFYNYYSPSTHFSILFLFLISINILKAYQELHDQGVLHLDPKFDNIMVNPITGAVKIIDFDFSKKFSPGQKTWCIQKIEDLPGCTLCYAAPECIATLSFRSANIDVTSDNYSVGLVLRLLLLGDRYTDSPASKNGRTLIRGERSNLGLYARFQAMFDHQEQYNIKNKLYTLTSDYRGQRPADLKETIAYFETVYAEKTTGLKKDPEHISKVNAFTAAEAQKNTDRSSKVPQQIAAKQLDQKAIDSAVSNYNTIKKTQCFSYIRRHFYTSAISTNTVSFLFKKQKTLQDDDRFAIVKNYVLANHDRALAKQFATLEALKNDPEIQAVYRQKKWF